MGYRDLLYVVGHSRGGTTWLGELISLHPDVGYIFEPFASQCHYFTGFDTQTLFNNARYIRLDKRGPLLPDHPSSFFFNMEPEAPGLRRYRDLAKMHVRRLVEAAFRDRTGYTLALKQPRLENLGWAASAIGADHVVVLDRHPFGVIGSYRLGNHWGWMDLEWPLAKASIPDAYEEFRGMIEGARDRYEKLLVLSYMRSQVATEFARQRGCHLVQYEDLCRDPSRQMREIFAYVNLPFSDEYRAKLTAKLQDTTPETGHFLDTRKRPEERADGWRRELPPEIVENLTSFILKHGMEIATPGHGMSPLKESERSEAIRFNRQRRRRAAKRRIRRLFSVARTALSRRL
jgi:hypothetical protein